MTYKLSYSAFLHEKKDKPIIMTRQFEDLKELNKFKKGFKISKTDWKKYTIEKTDIPVGTKLWYVSKRLYEREPYNLEFKKTVNYKSSKTNWK